MSDQIKVLSRDEADIDGDLITRRDALAMSSSRCAPALLRFGASQALRMMDAYEEPAPKWEPGMVLESQNGYYRIRLDKKDEDGEGWDVTPLYSTTDREWGDRIDSWRYWKIYRRKGEFKEGDWFECVSGTFRCTRVGCGLVWSGEIKENAVHCRHVPPPKEQPRKQALGDLARQEQAEGKYRCDLPYEKEVMPNEIRTDKRIPEDTVTGDSPSGNKTSERFSGPHWDTANKYAAENIAAYKCICDIRDAWLEKEGRE